MKSWMTALLGLLVFVAHAQALPLWWVPEGDPWPPGWHTTWRQDEFVGGGGVPDWYIAVSEPFWGGDPWTPVAGAEFAAVCDWAQGESIPLDCYIRWRDPDAHWHRDQMQLTDTGEYWSLDLPGVEVTQVPWLQVWAYLDGTSAHQLWYEGQMIPEPAALTLLLAGAVACGVSTRRCRGRVLAARNPGICSVNKSGV